MKDGKVEPGDVLIDERTGEQREVVSVIRVEDLDQILERQRAELPGSSAGYAAHYGVGTSRDRQERSRQRKRLAGPVVGTCARREEN